MLAEKRRVGATERKQMREKAKEKEREREREREMMKELKERQQLVVQEAKRGNDKHPGEKEERGGGTVSRVRFLPPMEEEDSRLQREAAKEARVESRIQERGDTA